MQPKWIDLRVEEGGVEMKLVKKLILLAAPIAVLAVAFAGRGLCG
jgi:hypothetical protein